MVGMVTPCMKALDCNLGDPLYFDRASQPQTVGVADPCARAMDRVKNVFEPIYLEAECHNRAWWGKPALGASATYGSG